MRTLPSSTRPDLRTTLDAHPAKAAPGRPSSNEQHPLLADCTYCAGQTVRQSDGETLNISQRSPTHCQHSRSEPRRRPEGKKWQSSVQTLPPTFKPLTRRSRFKVHCNPGCASMYSCRTAENDNPFSCAPLIMVDNLSATLWLEQTRRGHPIPYITAQQAAEEVGLSYSRMRQLLNEGRIKGAFKTPQNWLMPSPVEILPRQSEQP